MVCYLFYLIAAPFATNLSGGVRTTDVMVNCSGSADAKKPTGGRPFLINLIGYKQNPVPLEDAFLFCRMVYQVL